MFLSRLRKFMFATTKRRLRVTSRLQVEALERREVPAVLVLPKTSLPTFAATFNMPIPGSSPVQVSGEPVSGGNFLGTLNGTTTLKASYCVDINQTLVPHSTYSHATVTTNGKIDGTAIANAGAITWLVANLGPKATTAVKQDALQAAIWRTEYGSTFQVDGVDNDNGAPSFNTSIKASYLADLAALGTHTASVSSVLWIAPGANPGLPKTEGQGLVAVPTPPTPPRVTKIAIGAHSGLTLSSFLVTYNEAMNLASVRSGRFYRVFEGVTVDHHLLFTRALAIGKIAYNSHTHTVTLTLAHPHKGPVEVLVERGVIATNHAVSTHAADRLFS